MTRTSGARAVLTAVGLLVTVLVPASLRAQARSAGRLLVTVTDQTGAVIPGATVTAVGQEDATRRTPVPPVTTSDQGIGTIGGLALGRYDLQVEFAGFDTSIVKDVRVRNGDNKQTVVLAIGKLEASATVAPDPQAAASDPQGRTFGSALTREQIDALSEDPQEAQRQLQDIAGGPGAVLRVDSFEGGQLPPKSQIKAIHVTRDAFAAENHSAGGVFIDIITQPGVGPLRGGLNVRLRDGALNSRNPFTATKGPEQTQNYNAGIGGSLIKGRSSFNLNISGTTSYQTPNLHAALPTGTASQTLNLRAPSNNLFVFSQVDYALTRDQTLRVGFNEIRGTNENLGVGAYDLPERAFSNENRTHFLRVQEAGPLGRRFFTNTRFVLNLSDSDSHAALEAPTVRVIDAFTSGGAQVSGGRHSRIFNVASDLDYVRGIHSVRTGVLFDGGWFRADDSSNYLGTYTFSSLAAFAAAQPTSYTIRVGNPEVRYFNLRTNLYVQDDIRVRKGLTLSPGLRYEGESMSGDFNNLGPRFGITWAPWASGRTTLRGSTGVFYDFISQSTYEQTLRVDGFHQQEVDLVNPSFPDPGTGGVVPPANRYLLSDAFRLARTLRVSAGIDQMVTPQVRVSLLYTYAHGGGLLRGDNLNAPVAGVRPNPAFGNVIEAVPDADLRQHALSFTFNVGPPPAPIATGKRIDWKRINVTGLYNLGWTRNNTDGDLAIPPGGTLAAEWGPTPQDVRHRLNLSITSQVIKNVSANFVFTASSGVPYTIRTGLDDNGDLVYNDRPQGVDRNTERAQAQMSLNANFQYTIPFGHRATALPPGFIVRNTNGAVSVEQFAFDNTRYRLSFFINGQNLTNHPNYVGYSGTLTSPFFGQPTAVLGMRKIDVGTNFNF